MDQPNPLHEFVKALARRQARLDAQTPPPANQNDKDAEPKRKQ